MGNHDPKAWEEGGDRKSAGDMTFVSLHHHTTFSYLDGFGTPDQHFEQGARMGMSAIGITEHGNVTSHVQAEKAADKYGMKFIPGCEVYTGGVSEDDRTQKKNHLTVLAENQDGYRNLLELVSRGWAEGYYYEPTVSGAMLREHASGLIVLSGCTGSLLATSLIGGKNVPKEDASYDRARKVARRFKRLLGDSYFLEVQAFPELDNTKMINKGIAELSHELGIPMVATLDAHYTTPDESQMQAILHNVRGGNRKTMEELERSWGYNVPLCPLSDADVVARLVGTGLTRRQAEAAVAEAAGIGERCNVRLPKVENLRYPLPPSAESPEWLFRKWVNEGWKYRGFSKLPEPERAKYVERVKYEMDLIQQKGFIDYFLFVSDVVRWAKDNEIPVGPARGSAAASLVCYLLRITEVNPMHFPNLLFERFIDINRNDLPDIDLDFDDAQRYRIREYLAEKYGSDQVGNIGTFTKYKGKNSLDDIQRSVYPDNWQCKADVDTIKGLLIERSSGDLRADGTIEDTAEMFPQVKELMDRWPELYKASLLEGNVRGMSVHAAGLVVANGPLTDACAVYRRFDANGKVKLDEHGEPMEVVSLDKHDAEYLNVMKLDALGLKTMGMIHICLTLLGMKLSDLYDVPLDDPETLRGFQEGDVVGVFQFDGRAMRSVNQGVVPDNFDEVCDINALARPGPLHSGATADYMDVKHGRKKAVHYHPIVDQITLHTNFQIVYQEQILQTVRLLGDFSWEEASRIRKIISKKRGEQEFNSMRDKFVKGAAKHGLKKDEAHKVFSMLATAGAYAFNAAHCVSYGMLAWWTMWLKRHHPAEFYVASLAKCNDDKKGKIRRDQLLRDTSKFGRSVKVGKIRINSSQASWSIPDPEDPVLVPGFMQVKGIGEKTAQAILEYRDAEGRFEDWDDLQAVKGVGPATVEAILDFWQDPDPFGLNLLNDTINSVRNSIYNGILAEDSAGYMGNLPMPTHTAAQVPYEKTPTNVEVVWLGVVRERNLKDIFELHHSRTGEHLDPESVKDPHLNEYVAMTAEDNTDLLVLTVDRWRYPKLKNTIWDITPDQDIVLVRGVKKGFQARRAIYITDIWVFDMSEE